MEKIIIILLTCIILVGCTNTSSNGNETVENMELAWGMYESQVRKIENIPEENETINVNDWSWIDINGQEILNCIGKLSYNFDNSKLTNIDFIPNQINNVEEMDKIYDTLKENINSLYGNPTIDELQESKNSDLQYHYTEWNIDNTLIILQDNKEALHISLGFHSSEYLKTYDESQTNSSETINVSENDEKGTGIKGRGISDSGRSEPNYQGLNGYVAIYDTFDLSKTDEFLNTPWGVPTYKKDKQFYEESELIDHKTEIKVISQDLEHKGYGTYSGYLLVERNDDKKRFYIDVKNFITTPYWISDDLIEAATNGAYIAEYNQISNFYPVDRSNDKVTLGNGIKVLVVDKTGIYGSGGPNHNTNSIEAVVFKEWRYGYGGCTCIF